MRQVEEDRRNALAIVRSVDRLERILRSLDETRRVEHEYGARARRDRPDETVPRMTRPARARRRRQRLAAVALAVSVAGPRCAVRLRVPPEREPGRPGPGLGLHGRGRRRRPAARRGTTGAGDTTTTVATASASGGTAGTPGSAGTAGHAGGTAAPAPPPPPAAPQPQRATSPAAPCGANGNQTPAGGNGGATAPGVTATTITVGNIASISGVAPGLTQSAQQATEAWAAYVNSTGGICGRQIKVQPFDDGNDSGTNYADAQQACSSDFAMVGNASGFDDGSAQAVGACGIPDMAAEVSTAAAGNTADIFGASPGNAHYWALGPANYLKTTYPNAITKAAMIYLNVSATQTQAAHEMASYTSDGFHYVYNTSTTPTNANYAANVQAMQSDGRAVRDRVLRRLLGRAAPPGHAAGQLRPAGGRLVLRGVLAPVRPADRARVQRRPGADVGHRRLRGGGLQPGPPAHGELDEPGGARLPPGHLRHPGLVGRPGLRAGRQGRWAPTSPGPP